MPQGRSGRVRKILSPTEIRSPDRPVRSDDLQLHIQVSLRARQQTKVLCHTTSSTDRHKALHHTLHKSKMTSTLLLEILGVLSAQ